MLSQDFKNNFGYWVCTTAHLYQRAMNEELMPRGITFRQCQVLACLALEGAISQVELAERMNIEPPTLVRVLDRMERDGLIERVSCDIDRRRKLIQPLTKAQPVWIQIMACATRVRKRAQGSLTSKQLATLNDLLGIVRANLGHEDEMQESASSRPRTHRRPSRV